MELQSYPEYTERHEGPVIVMGGGPDAFASADEVRHNLGRAVPVIAVAGMCVKTENIFTVTGHHEILQNVPGAEKHSIHVYPSDQRRPPKNFDGIEHVWHGPMMMLGTSSLPAAMIAKAVGFSPVILCGVPLTKVGYVDGYKGSIICDSEFDTKKQLRATLETRHATWKAFHERGELEGVYSMSGFTRNLLGGPKWQ